MQYIKTLISTIAFICFCNFGYSQSNLDAFLNSVKQNNKTLKSAKELYNSNLIETTLGLTPDNPEVDFGYFPGNSSEIGTKQVFGISQSFDFPTVYLNQNKIAKLNQEYISKEYETLELDVFKQAKTAYNYCIYYNKKSKVILKRKNSAELLYQNYLKKQENGDATQLDINKALLFLLEQKNNLRQIQNQIKQNNQFLKLLNGGMEYQMNDTIYPASNLDNWENIKLDLLKNHQSLQEDEIQNNIAQASLKLAKHSWLPNFNIGYESEKILSDTYRGVKGGISIPLWKEKNKINYAKANIVYAREQALDNQLIIESNYHKKYLESETLLENFIQFKNGLQQMNNNYLLKRSLELGQISAIEYFMELNYFYQVSDQLLNLELQYYLSLIELYDYK